MINNNKIAVVIPCYKVRSHILQVIETMPVWVDSIIVVDDCCPMQTGKFLEQNSSDKRLKILYHKINQGVGGAVITGYRMASDDGCDIVVKMDGDGQMDPMYLNRLLSPLVSGRSDYVKGNRFYHLDSLTKMPLLRRIGNIGLTLLTKISSGFWRISDPTNGYTAIHSSLLEIMSLDQLSRRYFFETSMLIQLNIIGATAVDIPMPARYGSEISSLRISKVLFQFPFLLIRGFFRRLIWKYFIYNVNATTALLVMGSLLAVGGGGFGLYRWIIGTSHGQLQTAGTVALALLPLIIGILMLLQAMLLDIMDRPDMPLHKLISDQDIADTPSQTNQHEKRD